MCFWTTAAPSIEHKHTHINLKEGQMHVTASSSWATGLPAPGLSEAGAGGVVKFLQTSRHDFNPTLFATSPSHIDRQLSRQNSTYL